MKNKDKLFTNFTNPPISKKGKKKRKRKKKKKRGGGGKRGKKRDTTEKITRNKLFSFFVSLAVWVSF